MIKLLESIFEKPAVDVKIFADAGPPMPNFQIVATNVRQAHPPENFILDDGSKLASIIEKWRFQPGGEVGRCDMACVKFHARPLLCLRCEKLKNIQLFRHDHSIYHCT